MENDANDELNPADALASATDARRAVARRIESPRWWNAAMALSFGLFMGTIAYARPPWTTIAIALWTVSFVLLLGARQDRSGVVWRGRARRRVDPNKLLMGVAVLAIFFAGMVAGKYWWDGAPIVAAVLVTVVMYLGISWANRKAVQRALEAL